MVRLPLVAIVLAVACDRSAETPAKTEPAKIADAKPAVKAAETKAPDPKSDPKPDPKPPEPTTPTTPTLPSFDSHAGGLWNDRAEGIALLHGGGFGVVGRCEPVETGRESEWDACVTLFDANGKDIESARLGGTGTDDVFEAAIGTKDGGLIAVGGAEEGGAREARAVRFGPDAKVIWERSFGGAGDDTALAIVANGDAWIVTGSSHRPEQELDAAVWWLDAEGNHQRERTFGGTAKDFAHAIAPVADGWVLAGFTGSKGAGKDDAWVLRIDAAGELLWDRTYGGAAHDGAFAIVVQPTGELVVAGDSDKAGWIARLDSKGALLGEARITSATKIRALVRTGDVLVGVGTGADNPLMPAWTARFDATTKLTSERVFVHPRIAATDVIATPDGGVAVIGDWPSLNSNYANFWLCKLDASGNGCG